MSAAVNGTKLKKLDVLGDDYFPDSESSAIRGQDKQGTTVVCIVGNGFIVTGVDSYLTVDGKLDKPDEMKLHHICDGVIAVHCGYVHDGEIILRMVRERCEVVPPLSLEEVVSWTIMDANEYLAVKKVMAPGPLDLEGSSLIVAGKIPKSSDKMEAFFVFSDKGHGFKCFRSTSHFCVGSDSCYARMYIESKIHLITLERDDPMAIAKHVLKALALAVKLSEGTTGGNLNIVIMHEDGRREMFTVKQNEDKSYGDDLDVTVFQLKGFPVGNS